MQEKWYEFYLTELAYFKIMNVLVNYVMVKCAKTLDSYEFNLIFSKYLHAIYEQSKA
jgi:hypothetical protein